MEGLSWISWTSVSLGIPVKSPSLPCSQWHHEQMCTHIGLWICCTKGDRALENAGPLSVRGCLEKLTTGCGCVLSDPRRWSWMQGFVLSRIGVTSMVGCLNNSVLTARGRKRVESCDCSKKTPLITRGRSWGCLVILTFGEVVVIAWAPIWLQKWFTLCFAPSCSQSCLSDADVKFCSVAS